MQIVINISEDDYRKVQDGRSSVSMMRKAIGNGKPLLRCKECKYFEYDSVANVDGIPLIVAHEICSRWGDGCKTREDGYCFLFEAKMMEVEETETCKGCMNKCIMYEPNMKGCKAESEKKETLREKLEGEERGLG